MKLFAIALASKRECATYQGRLIVHNDRAELEYLFPMNEVIEVTGTDMPVISVKDHPDNAGLTWPLKREDFL